MSLIDKIFGSLDDRLKKVELITSTQLPPPSELSVLMAGLDLTLKRNKSSYHDSVYLYKGNTLIHHRLYGYPFGNEPKDTDILQYITDNQELITLIPKGETKVQTQTISPKRIYKKKSLTTKKK